MADITITMQLSEDKAEALAQMCKRIGWAQMKELSSDWANYSDGRPEIDHMLDGVLTLQRALAKAGFAPR